MRLSKIFVVATFNLLLSPLAMADAINTPPNTGGSEIIARQVYDMTNVEGQYKITPARCPPRSCKPLVGQFKGQFTATISGSRIAISRKSISSTGNNFDLPDDPFSSEGGVQSNARFKLENGVFGMEGFVDSRAFDGPLVEYRLKAKANPAVVTNPGFNPRDFYLVNRDYRKCASPMCGGIFVKKVNSQLTQCADGEARSECYVAEADWSHLGFDPFSANPNQTFNTKLLIRGKLGVSPTPEVGKLGRFIGVSAYRPANDADPVGAFYGLENNGIVCITSPCFSYNEYRLNSRAVSRVSDIDFSGVKSTEEDLATAYLLMADGEVIPAIGVNKRVKQMAGVGITLVAQQFYLPIKMKAETCSEGYEDIGKGCRTKNGCAFPLIEQTYFGGAQIGIFPPPPPRFSCVEVCDKFAEPVSPGYCAVYLP